jgi:hypothetical protein
MTGERALPADGRPSHAAPPADFDIRAAGWLLALVSLLAGLEAFGLFRRSWELVWPGVLLAGGLAGAILAWRSDRARGLPLRLAGGLLAGGLGEVARAAGWLPELVSFAWPAALLALSALIALPHVHMGGHPRLRLGATVALAGLLRALEAVFGVQPGAVGTGWFVFLFVAAVQMLRLGRQAGDLRRWPTG